MKAYILLVVGSLFLTGCTSSLTSKDLVLNANSQLDKSQLEMWNYMVGRWYGNQLMEDGGVRQQITERFNDGTYKIIFRYKKPDSKVKEDIEVGQWGIAGPIYFSIYRGWIDGDKFIPANSSEPSNYNAYKIIHLTNEKFKYKSYSTESVYSLIKVTNDFTFPDL